MFESNTKINCKLRNAKPNDMVMRSPWLIIPIQFISVEDVLENEKLAETEQNIT